MTTFILAFFLLAAVMAVMAVGVIFQNKPIKGSCGGMAALGLDTECEICGGDRNKCDEVNQADDAIEGKAGQAVFYDASQKSSRGG